MRRAAAAVVDLVNILRLLGAALVLLFGPLPRCQDRCPWEPRIRCRRPPGHPSEEHWADGGFTWRDWDSGLVLLIEGATDDVP